VSVLPRVGAAASGVLHEGLGSFVKSIVTGGFESRVESLRGEAEHVATPEQQVIVLRKVTAELVKLIKLRHAPGPLARFIHYEADWFERHVERNAASKELSLRVGEGIADLVSIRDRLLARKWDGDPDRSGKLKAWSAEQAATAAPATYEELSGD
jgi:hypothetical protein